MKRLLVLSIVLINVLIFTALSKPFLRQFRNTDTLFNRGGSMIYDFNKLDIEISGDVMWKKLILESEGIIIFKNGKKIARMSQNHGHSNLKIIYDDIELSNLTHFKSNSWESNDYKIQLSKNSERFLILHEIDGTSFENKYHRKVHYYNKHGGIGRMESTSQNEKFAEIN